MLSDVVVFLNVKMQTSVVKIEELIETHICKLCVILLSRVLRGACEASSRRM